MTTFGFHLLAWGTPGGMEIILVFLVVLLLFGAKKLPQIARSLGKTLEEFRRAAREVTDEVMHNEAPRPPEPDTEDEPAQPLLESGEDDSSSPDNDDPSVAREKGP